MGLRRKRHQTLEEDRIQWRIHRSTSSARSTARKSTTRSTRRPGLATRFDFRGTDTGIAWKGEEAIEITSSTEERVKAAIDVFKEKLVRRDISMKSFDVGEPQASGKGLQGHRHHQAGHQQRERQEDHQAHPRRGPQGVKAQIQGDEVRVSSKKRDDLQAVIAMLKKADLDVALQFVNYR